MSEPLKVIKYGTVVHVSRSELLDYRLVEPTDAERAARQAHQAEWEQRVRSATEALPEFLAALAAVTDPVARAVLDLHERVNGKCIGEDGDWDGERVDWPCQTVAIVATALGIQVPPDLDIASAPQ